jgi:outer membrane receptor protein involved in Fe transport
MRKRIIYFILLFISCINSYAGIIQGVVKDAKSGEALVGATIYLKGESQKGTTSGLDGSFIIRNISGNTVVLVCNCMGCKSLEKEVSFTGAETNKILIELSTSELKLQEVEVTARNHATDQSARNIEKISPNEVNIVSAKSIELSPDLNIANVIARVSGVTIERNATGDGQYAIIRGMDKRFSYTMVNGVKIPGTNNKYRYVPLDIFPSFLVDRLEVSKSLTPNMEGDALGGAVNMVMKDAPNRLQLNLNIATGYNEIFIERDFMGFDSKAVNYKSPYELHGESYAATPTDFTTKNLNLNTNKPTPNMVADFSIGDRFLNKKLGVILAGSFSNNYKGSNSTSFGAENDTLNLPLITGKSFRTVSEQSTQIGIHTKIDFQLNKSHKFIFYNAYMNFTSEQIRQSQSSDLNNSSNSLSSYSLRYRLNNQQLLSSVLQGEHKLADNLKGNWSFVYGNAINQTPDYINLSMFNEISNNVKLPLTISNGGSTRRWEHNTDKDWAGYLNLIYTPIIANTLVELTAGGLYRDKKRTSFFNEYKFFAILNTDYKSIQGRDWTDFSDIQWKNSVDLNNNDPLNYNAYEKIAAGYFQFKFKIKKLEVVGGLRAENTNQGYYLIYTKGDVPPIGKQIYTDLLPSLHFRYMPTQRQNVRASYFRSVNRPGFLEIVPYLVVGEEYTEMGNPGIKHTVADNIDIRYEFFPKPLEQFMIGAFYKNIQNPIEYGWSNPQGSKGNIYYMPDNYGTAKNLGMEVDFIKYFSFIGIKANYTFTHSSITTLKRYYIHKSNGWQLNDTTQTRPLFGQSAHVANISLLFKDTHSGWDAQLSANYTGERIYLVSRYLNDDQWQKGFIQLDASIEKKFKNGMSLYLKAKNLLNTPMEVYIKKINPANSELIIQDIAGNTTTIRQDHYMPSFLVGFRYKIN